MYMALAIACEIVFTYVHTQYVTVYMKTSLVLTSDFTMLMAHKILKISPQAKIFHYNKVMVVLQTL